LKKAKEELTAKQKLFCDYYLISLNGKESAIKSGYSPKTANVIASQNLEKPHIKRYLDKQMNKRSKELNITAKNVLQEISKLAFANISDVLDISNDGIVIKDLSNVDLSYIAEAYEITDVNNEKRIRLKFHDKTKNLELLCRHLGLFKDKIEHSVDEKLENWLKGIK